VVDLDLAIACCAGFASFDEDSVAFEFESLLSLFASAGAGGGVVSPPARVGEDFVSLGSSAAIAAIACACRAGERCKEHSDQRPVQYLSVHHYLREDCSSVARRRRHPSCKLDDLALCVSYAREPKLATTIRAEAGQRYQSGSDFGVGPGPTALRLRKFEGIISIS
jgi:hypothetical protein